MKGINYLEQIEKLKYKINTADAILIGAGSGLSTAAGLEYYGKRFTDNFSDFISKYKLTDMYSAGFYPFKSLEEYWAYWSRHIDLNRYKAEVGKPYKDLLELVKNKNYFVITTNVDHMFQKAGFDSKNLFCTQGDYGLWQCSLPCRKETFNNEKSIKLMVKEQKNMRIPKELIPYCPYCKAPLTMNLRVDDKFVEDEKWQEASRRYLKFKEENLKSKIIYLEIGVGYNTPGIIKYPFRIMTSKNPNSIYATINIDDHYIPKEIENRTICIKEEIGKALEDLK
ncbi:SIR2 family NAD-dependent protein deacylase [Miniphocaeibacter halophilus]|uniref:Sir2 silent information regulator family NAD-dependent deacetylase n=1 Tax=Miniphocaeibacter halophilus TaxID=2931922 RepID=A0AC61MMQ2_9FIRM|nr:hypothetical protein [Miniphocaeibacter halophilus]QQK06939.1 Sir2 silent information regulator family NAD-dependent deacetylase [Miniphocaeibacter halophilus]